VRNLDDDDDDDDDDNDDKYRCTLITESSVKIGKCDKGRRMLLL
jgi:hypothetical protein